MKSPSVRTRMFMQILRKAKHGTIILTLPDGSRNIFGEGDPAIKVQVKEWTAIDMLFDKGDLGLAKAIIKDLLVVDDVAALVEWACRNDQDLAQALHGTWYGTVAAKLRHLLNGNNRAQPRKILWRITI